MKSPESSFGRPHNPYGARKANETEDIQEPVFDERKINIPDLRRAIKAALEDSGGNETTDSQPDEKDK